MWCKDYCWTGVSTGSLIRCPNHLNLLNIVCYHPVSIIHDCVSLTVPNVHFPCLVICHCLHLLSSLIMSFTIAYHLPLSALIVITYYVLHHCLSFAIACHSPLIVCHSQVYIIHHCLSFPLSIISYCLQFPLSDID